MYYLNYSKNLEIKRTQTSIKIYPIILSIDFWCGTKKKRERIYEAKFIERIL